MNSYSYDVNRSSVSPYFNKVMTLPEFHRTRNESIANKLAVTALVVGILALCGATLAFLSVHGVLPHQLFSYIGVIGKYRWVLLGGGVGLFGIGSLAKLYLYRKNSQFKAKVDEVEINKWSRNRDEMFFSLQQVPSQRAFMRFTEGMERVIVYPVSGPELSWIKTTKIYTAPEGLFMLCTSDSKGYTTHFYKDLASLERAEERFTKNKYTKIDHVETKKTKLIAQFVYLVSPLK